MIRLEDHSSRKIEIYWRIKWLFINTHYDFFQEKQNTTFMQSFWNNYRKVASANARY